MVRNTKLKPKLVTLLINPVRTPKFMQQKLRFSLGLLIFALLFFYLGVRAYFVFFHVGSYDGWTSQQNRNDGRWYVTSIDPTGPATVLQIGDEFVAINGITRAQNANIGDYNRRVPPGTNYQMTVRRNGQLQTFALRMVEVTQRRTNSIERAYVFISPLFVLTALIIFLLKSDNKQARLLAFGLGTFIGLNTWTMPIDLWGRGAELLVGVIKFFCLFSLPLLAHFFLIFPERSSLLKRWPKLERWLYWPYLLIELPSFGMMRMPDFVKTPYFHFPPIRWLDSHSWFTVPMPTFVVYLCLILVFLAINYRAAQKDARRRLRVIVVGSAAGLLTLIGIIVVEFFGVQSQFPNAYAFLVNMMVVTPALIPLSFAYAIIRHKVIPVSLMIRRGVRYLLVSRGAVILEFLTVIVALTLVLRTVFTALDASPTLIGIGSGILSIFVWQTTRVIHNRYLAPLIDRKFFRQSYNAQQIMAELSEDLRTTTDRAQLPQLVATKIQAALQTERVTILLKDDATKAYVCAYSCDYDPRSPHSTSSLNGHHLTAKTALTNRLLASANPLAVNWDNETVQVEEVETLTPTETATLRAMNSALLLPLKGKDEMSGIISLGARLGDLPFSNEDKRLLLSVSAPMSFALENTRLIAQMIEDARRREELEAENEARAKELEEARQLQLSMLPKKVPELPHLEIAAYMKTATEVGGDYYDFHVSSDGTLTIAVGDATGHGLKAGTVVTAMKGLFLTHAQNDEVLSVLAQSSHALKAMNLRSLFMALTLVKLNGNTMQIASAGMPPALIYHAETNTVEEVLMKTMPLGSLRNYPYRDAQFTLQSGDVVVLLSDGFPERFNADGEILGFDKAQEVLQATAHLSAQQIVEQFIRTEEQWAQGFAQNDDVTFVVLKIR